MSEVCVPVRVENPRNMGQRPFAMEKSTLHDALKILVGVGWAPSKQCGLCDLNHCLSSVFMCVVPGMMHHEIHRDET
jgi:hypothetical protein